MFDFGDENSVFGRSNSNPSDLDNSEYRFKNEYSQEVYSDAHYVRMDENTVPPRYYEPRDRAVKSRSSGFGGFVKALCMCLVCAVLGGLGGAAVVSMRLDDRISTVEENVSALAESIAAEETVSVSRALPEPVSEALPASEIYAAACEQTVGITTDVTYTNFFGMSSSSAVSGTGFIVSDQGYIVTNYHVVSYAFEDDMAVSVILHDGTKYAASIVGAEESSDVAVLKIDAEGLHEVSFGSSDSLKVGDTVYAVGNPLGELEFSMSNGYISALDRVISTDENSDPVNMLQIDAAFNSGNSGGPLYNDRGQVVGIVTAKYRSSDVEGIGFAIPINDVRSIVDDLITKGYVTGKADPGVIIDHRYNSLYSRYYGMPMGAYVSYVEDGSCAAAAGLQPGDIITVLGDFQVSGYNDFQQVVRRYSAGDAVRLSVYRAGETLTLSLVFDEAKPD